MNQGQSFENSVGEDKDNSKSCSTMLYSPSLGTYLNELSETAAPETKSDVANCGGKTFYICNRQSQASETEWKACKIKQEVTACEVELNQAREGGNGKFKVTGEGLPPCGKTFYICNNAVYDYDPELIPPPCAQT